MKLKNKQKHHSISKTEKKTRNKTLGFEDRHKCCVLVSSSIEEINKTQATGTNTPPRRFDNHGDKKYTN